MTGTSMATPHVTGAAAIVLNRCWVCLSDIPLRQQGSSELKLLDPRLSDVLIVRPCQCRFATLGYNTSTVRQKGLAQKVIKTLVASAKPLAGVCRFIAARMPGRAVFQSCPEI